MKYSTQLGDEELVKVSGGAGDGGAYMYYAVKNGDTWASIAAKYGTTEEALRQITVAMKEGGVTRGDPSLYKWYEYTTQGNSFRNEKMRLKHESTLDLIAIAEKYVACLLSCDIIKP